MTNPSNTSVTAQFGAGERGEPFTPRDAWDELVHKDDRTSPEDYPDMCLITFEELRDFMDRAAPVSHTSVKDGGGPQCACMRGGYPIGNCVECDDPAARDAVADGAREKLASDAPVWMSATAAGAWADGYNACLEALRSAPVKVICPNCNDANSCGDYEGPTCEVCLGDGWVSAPVKAVGSEVMRECDWPANTPFKFLDEPGEHEPCYVVMPGGAMLPLNHHVGEGVDIARAKFIVAACNAALVSADSNDEFYELGKRDGYEDAIQDLDIATGGDGEFKGSTIPGETVDVPTMKARIISRAVPARATSAHHARAIAEILDPVAFDPISLRNDQHPTWMCRRETAIETANKILSLAPVKAVGSEALREALSQISATLKYSRIAREEAALMVQQIILDALAHPGSGDAEPGAWRNAIIEECAKVAVAKSRWAERMVEDHGADSVLFGTIGNTADDIADLIRALATDGPVLERTP